VSGKNGITLFLPLTLANFQNCGIVTVPCEMVVFKKCNDSELCEDNCHARLSHLKRLLKNIYLVTFASFLFTDEKIFTVAAPKNLQND